MPYFNKVADEVVVKTIADYQQFLFERNGEKGLTYELVEEILTMELDLSSKNIEPYMASLQQIAEEEPENIDRINSLVEEIRMCEVI